MMRFAYALFLALALPLPALAQDGEDQWRDRAAVASGGSYATYPAASVSRRNGSTVYAIDMTTALQPMPNTSVAMTWTPQGMAHELCFEHAAERRCRWLDATWDPQIAPRFMPTKSDHWPTVYVSFTDKDGHASMIVYAGGTIATGEEEVAQLSASHNKPQ